MADMPQVLATYDALVGVALGAGLTYGFGALNRRHREAREDRTRWYQARFEAYSAVPEVLTKGVAIATRGARTGGRQRVLGRHDGNDGRMRFVGSDELPHVPSFEPLLGSLVASAGG